MKTYAIRLQSGQDLRKEINEFTKIKNIQAGIILTCVGSLKKAKLRLANEEVKLFSETFEIVSLTGTLSQDGNHVHISLSNSDGDTIGGHLKEGCIIHTTAEIVICELDCLKFSREFDESTGFKELKVNKN